MPAPAPSSSSESNQRCFLLSQAIDLLRSELTALSGPTGENLPELKKEKVVLASRLHELPSASAAMESPDLVTLKSQISDLEEESRRKIENHLELIGRQIVALQDQHQYWRECLNVSFRKFYEPIPSP